MSDDLSAFGILRSQLHHHPGLPDSPSKPWEGEPVTPKPDLYLCLHAAADDNQLGLTLDVLELHGPKPWMVSPTGEVSTWECQGCDAGGYDWEYPRWPCRTTELIAERLGVDVTE